MCYQLFFHLVSIRRGRERIGCGAGVLSKKKKKREGGTRERRPCHSRCFSLSLSSPSCEPSPSLRLGLVIVCGLRCYSFFFYSFVTGKNSLEGDGNGERMKFKKTLFLFLSLSLSLSFLSFLLFSSLAVAPRTFSISLSRALSKESFSPRLQSPPLSKRNTPIKKIPRKGSRKKFMKEPRGTPRASTDPKTPPPRSPPPRPPAPARSEAVPCTSPS